MLFIGVVKSPKRSSSSDNDSTFEVGPSHHGHVGQTHNGKTVPYLQGGVCA